MESYYEMEVLYRRYLANDLSEEELDRFLKALHDQESEQFVSNLMDATWKDMYSAKTEKGARVFSIRRNRVIKYLAAASVVATIGLGLFFLFADREPVNGVAQQQGDAPVQPDVAPGGDRATLTLADGTVVFLDSAAKGTLTDQGGITVINLDGQLAYQGEESKAAEVLYNTVSTPRGGQYQLVLADGTKVWLNAASSLRFPTSFPGEERTVELTGEGYFEVAHNAAKPFHVKVGELDVEVLGTHFNINSYSDEPFLKTTLLEGRVSVARNEKKVILNPGQQAVADPEGASIRVSYKVDVEEAIAWKNGLIYFDGADVGMVMRQIARWYDVEVAYTGNIKAAHLSGKVSRKLNLTQVIRVLEESGIDIKAEGKKLTATPKL